MTSLRDHTILGRTGLRVSRMGIGAGYGVPAKAVEKAYHEYGVNYFVVDGIRRAGITEAVRNLARTEREQMVIVLSSYGHLGFMAHRAVNRGLRSLGIEYADVLLLGWYNSLPSKRILKAFQELNEHGKVNFLAMSGHNRKMFGRIARDPASPIDIFHLRYNAAHPGAESDIFPHIRKDDRPGITVFTATSAGQLLKQRKLPVGTRPLTAPECYRFVLSHSQVDLCMTGPASEAQMDEALTALDQGPLSQGEMAYARKVGAFKA
ncbi:aldo/keto reductase [Fibrobacterota bacterium]